MLSSGLPVQVLALANTITSPRNQAPARIQDFSKSMTASKDGFQDAVDLSLEKALQCFGKSKHSHSGNPRLQAFSR